MAKVTMGKGVVDAVTNPNAARLLGLMRGLNPFKFGNIIKGAGLAAGAGALYGLPGQVEQNILSQGLDETTGKAKTGIISGALDLFDGSGTRFSQEGLTDTFLKNQLTKVKRSPTARQAAGYDSVRAPEIGESVEEYAESVGPDLRRAEADADFGGKKGTYERGMFETLMQQNFLQAQRESDNRFEIRRDALQEKIDSREGQQGLLELQLLQNKDQFNRELQYKREKDSADRRQDLIQSIQALGMAFAL